MVLVRRQMTQHTWCVVQHDAPHWRDCLCYCNPLWFDHGGDWVEPTESLSHRPPARTMHAMSDDINGGGGDDTDMDMTVVSLSTTPRYRKNYYDDVDRESNNTIDKFTLPCDYNPVHEYERLFGEFNLANGEKRADNSALRLTTDAQFTAACRRLDEGDPHQPPKSLYTDCNLYVIYVRQYDSSGTDIKERHALIEDYERYRHKYRDCRVFKDDAETADIALELARTDAGSRTTPITKEQRLEYYRKALFFTHDLAKKVKLSEEYVQYCNSLKK